MMCMISVQDVLKVYSPADMTPTLAVLVWSVKPMDLTAPAKYSFTFSMSLTRHLKRSVA